MGITNDTSDKKSRIQEILKRTSNIQVVNSDDALRKSDASSLSEHNEQYTLLLKAYVEDFKENSINKKTNKQDLYKIAKNLLLWIPIITLILVFIILILIASNKIEMIEALPELISAMATLLGTFMVVPKIITKYLFNKEEEKYLAKIIGKIQEYDSNIRGGL
jgi:Fe2+ transport system protein B